MSGIIEKFYKENNTPAFLLPGKIKKLQKHSDIASEFEYWIQHHSFKENGVISVEGYTAKQLSEISEYLKGEGAFMMLIELRENPKKALASISKGFKRK